MPPSKSAPKKKTRSKPFVASFAEVYLKKSTLTDKDRKAITEIMEHCQEKTATKAVLRAVYAFKSSRQDIQRLQEANLKLQSQVATANRKLEELKQSLRERMVLRKDLESNMREIMNQLR